MKKQLKKLLLVFGFVAMATISNAIPVSYDCRGGRTEEFEAFGDTMEELMDDIELWALIVCADY